MRQLVDRGFARAVGILERNRALLDRTAERLLKIETLNVPEIEALKREVVVEPAAG